jgi:hypothetical protein
MLMSFTDPLSIVISGTTTALPRVGTGENGSDYRSGDGLIHLSANHDYGKRTRRVLRLDTSKIAPDPFKPVENVKLSMGIYIVFDLPTAGFSNTEAMYLYTGFKTLYTGTSDALINKLLGGES